MAQLTRSTKIGGSTVLQSNTVARATDIETDILTLFTGHNNHDTGTSSWAVVSASGPSSVPLVADNTSGTQNICNLKDNGTIVWQVADGGIVTATGVYRGPDGVAAAPSYSFASAGNTDNGMYLDASDTLGFSAGGTKRLSISATAITAAVAITPSAGVKGTSTNDTATAGNVGEYISATYNSTTAGSTTVWSDAANIALTAGDWIVSHQGITLCNGNVAQTAVYGWATVSGNNDPGNTGSYGTNKGGFDYPINANGLLSSFSSTGRLSISAPATVYAKISAVYASGVGTKFIGAIQAWRVR